MLKYILIFIASTTLTFGQKTACSLTYTNETKVKGFATITENNTIEFSATADGKTETLDYTTVSSIVMYVEKPTRYTYLKVSEQGNPILLKRLNKFNTYPGNEIVLFVSAKEAITFAATASKEKPNGQPYSKYYLKKRFSEEITTVSTALTHKKWKYKMIKYLKGCPVVIESLRFGAYTQKTMVELIENYNYSCS